MFTFRNSSLRVKYTSVLMLLLIQVLAYAQPREPHVAWAHTYNGGLENNDSRIEDIYLNDEGDYTFCGRIINPAGDGLSDDCWVVRIDPDGGLIWSRRIGEINRDEGASSLIQTDDGGFALAGSIDSQIAVWRLNEQGEVIWVHLYGTARASTATGIIELKEGVFAICGRDMGDEGDNPDGMIAIIEQNGDLRWLRIYGGRDQEKFSALREREGGLIAAGHSIGQNDMQPFVVLVDFNGDPIAERYLDAQDWPNVQITSLTSCRAGGYAIAGWTFNRQTAISCFYLARLDRDGSPLWNRRYNASAEREVGSHCGAQGLVSASDGGFFMAGRGDHDALIRLDSDGNELWRIDHEFGVENNPPTNLQSVIVLPDNSITSTGYAFIDDNGEIINGLVVHYTADFGGPRIVQFNPEVLEFNVLSGDSALFWIRAVDEQEDSLAYLWTINYVPASDNDSIMVKFDSLGVDTIVASVSDWFSADSIRWLVSVRDLFIYSISPDTLHLVIRRDTTLTFSLDSVAVVAGDPVQYAWTLTNIDNFEREDAGTEPHATVQFLRSGNFQLEGLAYRGESSDNVVWTIQVRSAILDFWPRALSLTVFADSLVNFGVLPFNPASDSLSYRWEVDGDSVGSDSTVGLRFAWDGQAEALSYRVSAIVKDGAEGDTVKWEVTVLDPNATPPTPPSIEGGEIPGAFGITSVSPNPFNNSTTIRFAVPSSSSSSSAQSASSAVNLTLHDLTGREVRKCVSAEVRAGEHSYILNGADLPAGIYLLNLRVGNTHKVAKVAIVR